MTQIVQVSAAQVTHPDMLIGNCSLLPARALEYQRTPTPQLFPIL